MPSVRQSMATDGKLNRAGLIGFRQEEKSKITITRNPFLLVMGESMILRLGRQSPRVKNFVQFSAREGMAIDSGGSLGGGPLGPVGRPLAAVSDADQGGHAGHVLA